MPKYLLGYHGGGMPQTPEEGAKVMAAWNSWMGQLGSKIVEPGNPTGRAMSIASNGSVSEGGGANPLSGYSLIEATSLDEAVQLASSCPQLMAGGSVEVCEIVNVM